jgi:Calcineurin-like phosphoesterase
MTTTSLRIVAVGDPQAPFDHVLEVLKAHGVLGNDGKIAKDVHLIVMGDYFDYGGKDERAEAQQAAAKMLGWFLGHAEERVTLLAGNHDLARIGELVAFDDAKFAKAQAEADLGYFDKKPSRPEEEFKKEYGVPSWEIVSRDFCAFTARQRTIVVDMMSAQRLRAAYAPSADLLMVHAGVTADTLDALGIPGERDARVIAQKVNRAFYDAFKAWRQTSAPAPFGVPGIHVPGNAEREGTGMFYHRAAADVTKAPGRRFDPKRLPTGITQVIGHIGDKKSRELLNQSPDAAKDGVLRHLVVKGDAIAYGHGVPGDWPQDAATMIFCDGTMRATKPVDYELFDVSKRAALR